MNDEVTFGTLVAAIQETHERLKQEAVRAVNVSLTIRNWVIGGRIVEFELRGSDRATYGVRLFESLSDALARAGQVQYHATELRGCRRFYLAYPQIRAALSLELQALLPGGEPGQIRGTASLESATEAPALVKSLSYSHLLELSDIGEEPKRAFYQAECQRAGWSVRQLRRQIGSLYFERSVLSTDKKGIRDNTASSPWMEPQPALAIRDPYVFEFLDLRPHEVVTESRVEDALLDKIQEFLLELGRGFCFEARQRRILIGDEHFFVDLVFYHRILKCHVLIELKDDQFRHEHLGQLNTYLNWYRVNEQAPGDNRPIGLLLCTTKNHALVEYATAGMDNKLFVTKYQLQLPSKEEIERVLESELRERAT